MIVVHSVTRGWQDMGLLLGVMGEMQPPIPCATEGCLVTSSILSYRHFSQTYCRKGPLGTAPPRHGGQGMPWPQRKQVQEQRIAAGPGLLHTHGGADWRVRSGMPAR